jgi:hypothetical protein
MLTYLSTYCVLICQQHQHAIYGVDEHLKRYHKMLAAERRALLSAYHHLPLLSPGQVPLPEPYSTPLAELAAPVDALVCCCKTSSESSESSSSSSSSGSSSSAPSRACGFISTSRKWMQQHVNEQHSIHLTRWSTTSTVSYAEHAAQLWKPVKVQTFFREKRYVRYFIVQEPQEQEHRQQHRQQRDRSQPTAAEQREAESHQQRLASLSYEWDIVASRDSQAIERVAEEASARDRTGWFKWTRWDEHLQAYPNWQLLSYAIRLPASDEPHLQRVVSLVEELLD